MTLEVMRNARDIKLDPRLQEYIEKKVSKLDRYLSGINEARVDITRNKNARSASDRNVSQITIMGKGFLLRSEERADDMFAAFDLSLDKLQRRMAKYKGKKYDSKRDRKSIAEEAGINMPSFFGYMLKYSIPILIPIFVVVTFVFF